MNNEVCENCLNAYNSPYDPVPLCVNKEWEAQFRKVDCHITKGGHCGTYQRRNEGQPPIQFPKNRQLSLFD